DSPGGGRQPHPAGPLPSSHPTSRREVRPVTAHPSPHAPALGAEPLGLDDFERRLARSKALARFLIAGLPTLGALASVFWGLPLFAALMAAAFLLATALTCRKALVTFTGKTLRLLVTAR